MARVSVCLPTYNGARFLAPAIESVLNQEFSDFELIICDDGSTDGSRSIIEQYVGKDRRIVYECNPKNLGLFANYNRCLQKSSGDVIKPFAQDDVLDNRMLSRVVAALAHPEVSLVATGKRWIDDGGNETKVLRPFPQERVISGREVILYNMIGLTNWVGEPSAVAFRRSRIGDGFDTKLYHYGDIDYWFRIVDGSSMLYLDEVLCSFRRHAGSATSKNHSGLYFALDILRMGKKYRRHLEEFGESEEQFQARAMEVIALNVDHLVRNEGLTAEGSRATGLAADDAADFKELSFHAFRQLTRVLAQLDALKCSSEDQNRHLQAQLDDIYESNAWKITAPLRSIAKHIGGA